MTVRVTLDSFNDIPAQGDINQHTDHVTITPLPTFISVTEQAATPLLGTPDNTILPADGMLLMYGDGGAGKTTLTIDACSHLASGTTWLNHQVTRPTRILLIENEGPRGKFREKLAAKHASWNGHPPFAPQISVLEEPWTRFTLQNPDHRLALAAHLSTDHTDIVVMGPLATLGMVGGGTPDEITAFEHLLQETRTLINHPYAYWIVHHENKAGDVSGAWERVPDTLVHIQAQGNGHTRLHWRKARWSSQDHGTSLDLTWADGQSYHIRDDPTIDYHARLLEAYHDDDQWRTAKEAARLIGGGEDAVKHALSDLVERGEMSYQKGPPGRHGSAQCYKLKGAHETSAHPYAPTLLPGVESEGAQLRSPCKGSSSFCAPTPAPGSAHTESSAPSAHLEDTDDGIPF